VHSIFYGFIDAVDFSVLGVDAELSVDQGVALYWSELTFYVEFDFSYHCFVADERFVVNL
jgi:hypothetical protein